MQDQLITIKAIRELLGKEYSSLSDREVETVITMLELMAEISIEQVKQTVRVPNST